MKKGIFIVLYGINNLGKTTQAKLLVEKLQRKRFEAEYLKYPIYSLEPTGPRINAYLREGNPEQLSAKDVQELYAQNRRNFEPRLHLKLDSGINIVAEDYTGTGLCWGIGAGVPEKYMLEINEGLLKEDISFLFEGERFREATEMNHTFETNDTLIEKVRAVHDRMGSKKGWIRIDANESIEHIHEKLWDTIKEKLV
ncbi:MAG: hypothetical protein ABII02_04680 [Candidatus Magasanikbacteria bacterium]